MRITEEEASELEKQMRRIGLFYCSGCRGYFSLRASRPGLFCCPCCGAPEGKVLSVKIVPHDDNDLDDDYD